VCSTPIEHRAAAMIPPRPIAADRDHDIEALDVTR